jgi:hypothetical protein
MRAGSGKLAAMIGLAGMVAATAPAAAQFTEFRSCAVSGNFSLASPGPWVRAMLTNERGCESIAFQADGTMFFERLFVEKQPANGKLTLLQRGRFTYVPNRGFKGRDNFVLEICGQEAGRPGCAMLQYDILVQ